MSHNDTGNPAYPNCGQIREQRDELLEAAKMALEVIRHVDGYVYQRAQKMDQLEAAINKAEGKS